jgi:hypothetical protein
VALALQSILCNQTLGRARKGENDYNASQSRAYDFNALQGVGGLERVGLSHSIRTPEMHRGNITVIKQLKIK